MSTPIDIKLIDSGKGYIDINVDSKGDIEKTTGLDTTIAMSIFCERRASKDEVLSPIRRRGWWGNSLSDNPGYEQGSKLWLLEQSRMTPENVNFGSDSANEGLSWGVEDNIFDGAETSATNNEGKLDLKAVLHQGSNVAEFRYFDALGASSLLFDEVN